MAVARGVVTVLFFFLVRLLFLLLFLVEDLAVVFDAVDFFFVLFFFFDFFFAAEACEVSNISVCSISDRPIQSHTPKEIATAANKVRYLFEFIICKITKKSSANQL